MCIAVVHFSEIICCNTEIANVLIVFENRIVSVQLKATAGCDTLLKRNRIIFILLWNTKITFVLYHSKWFRWEARPKCTLVEGAPLKLNLGQLYTFMLSLSCILLLFFGTQALKLVSIWFGIKIQFIIFKIKCTLSFVTNKLTINWFPALIICNTVRNWW